MLLLPFQPRNVPKAEEVLRSDEYEFVEVSPRIVALSMEPPRQPRPKRAKPFARRAEVASVEQVGASSRLRPWPKVPRHDPDAAESSISAAVITPEEADEHTQSHALSGRRGMSLGAGLFASTLLALGIFAGILLGNHDEAPKAAAAYVDPGSTAAHAPPPTELLPQFQLLPPVLPPMMAPVPVAPPPFPPVASFDAATPAERVFAPLVIGRPAARPAKPSVAWRPRKAASPPAPKAAAPPKSTGDSDIDAARQANLRATQETAGALGGSD